MKYKTVQIEEKIYNQLRAECDKMRRALKREVEIAIIDYLRKVNK